MSDFKMPIEEMLKKRGHMWFITFYWPREGLQALQCLSKIQEVYRRPQNRWFRVEPNVIVKIDATSITLRIADEPDYEVEWTIDAAMPLAPAWAYPIVFEVRTDHLLDAVKRIRRMTVSPQWPVIESKWGCFTLLTAVDFPKREQPCEAVHKRGEGLASPIPSVEGRACGTYAADALPADFISIGDKDDGQETFQTDRRLDDTRQEISGIENPIATLGSDIPICHPKQS